jgi:ATP-dependent helicase/DNAse subunit B
LNEDLIAELEARQTIREQPFRSDKPIVGPLVAWFRTVWNSISTRWYVLPLLQQQNRFNHAVTRATQALVERLDELDQRVIASDRDATQWARTVAEDEYRLRQLEKRIAQESDDLARRLSRLEEMLAAMGLEQRGESD